MKTLNIGGVSHGTLRNEDLLESFISELEGIQLNNGAELCKPEHFPLRDQIANLIGEAQDCFTDDGSEVREDCEASEVIRAMQDMLNDFCPPYCYFGTHPGDGSDFGVWPMDIEDIKGEVGFVSSRGQDCPDDDFTGEWLHVSDHGNCTLYVRENGSDREVWSIV